MFFLRFQKRFLHELEQEDYVFAVQDPLYKKTFSDKAETLKSEKRRRKKKLKRANKQTKRKKEKSVCLVRLQVHSNTH